MIKKAVLVLGVLLVAAAPMAWANICAHDTTPAASLLFPYVVFDYSIEPSMYSNPIVPRADSILTITNISPDAQVLRVTLWTDFGVAILDFNVLLTGYDVVRFPMGDVLLMGQLPVTISTGHSGSEGTASNGPVSEGNPLNGSWLAGFLPDPQPTSTLGARCSPTDPGYPGSYVTPISPAILALFQTWLMSSQTADRSHTSDCSPPYSGGSPLPTWFEERDADAETWMYITVDVVQNCSRGFPDEVGYWIPGAYGGEARYDNVLVGEILWTYPPFIYASAPAVHLEADTDLGAVVPSVPGGSYPYSFYARYSLPNDDYSDWREPLPTAWAMSYYDLGIYGGTSVVLWKGSTYFSTPMDMDFDPHNENPTTMIASSCHPYTYYAWDDEENVIAATVEIDPNLLPLTVQEVPVSQLEIVDNAGWLLFLFPPSNYPVAGGPSPPDHYQTWMGSFFSRGSSKAFMAANPLANANCWPTQTLPDLGVNFDYVNSSGYVSGNPPKRKAQ